MSSERLALHLDTPPLFPKFPYDVPYDIQLLLMRHLYASIEDGKVAIAESPTGTGKTSSLLCAAFTWLDDHRDRARKGQLDGLSSGNSDGPDWVLAQTRSRLQRQLEIEDEEYEERLADARRREEVQRRISAARVRKRQKRDVASEDEDDDIYLPDDDLDITSSATSSVLELDARQDSINNKPVCTKIFYASRTHSQLSQVILELKKLRRFDLRHQDRTPPVIVTGSKRALDAALSVDRGMHGPQSRAVALGSRKQFCINDELKARSADIDESCRELLQAGSEKRCPYIPRMEEETRLHDFRDQILASPKDIEDLVVAGQSAHVCPYFASRAAVSQAELVTLPYNLLLQPAAREALNIDLSGHVVVIDEGHNLTPSLLDLSTVSLPLRILNLAVVQLGNYFDKFRSRLAAKHRLHLQRLILLLKQLKTLVADWHNQQLPTVTTVQAVLSKLGRNLDGINVLEIQAYLKSSRIARKAASYAQKEDLKRAATSQSSSAKRRTATQPPLYIVQDFIVALAEANDDGRIVVTPEGGSDEAMIRYQSLNAAPLLRGVVEAARSVILAGGTMSPIPSLINSLFRYLPQNQIATFSCGHIIPSGNLRAIALSRGPRVQHLKLSAANLSEGVIVFEVGQVLQNFARITPGGMVVFLPSYKVLDFAMMTWKEGKILDGISTKKKIFLEPNSSSEVPATLQAYAEHVQRSSSGAILFAVIGAKLSEGLNFADDLARMVVIIGLPFPNLGSPELIERLRYADRLAGHVLAENGSRYGPAGRELYENMCMNSVNQSIGRAIRHRNDWAALVLIDERYLEDRISKKLPGWISQSITRPESFGQAIKSLGQFFGSKKPV